MSKSKKNTGTEKTIEQTYKQLTDRKHILQRPDTYVGSLDKETISMWIYNEKRKDTDAEFIHKEISYIPGLFKIFDEILVNARDHFVNCANENKDPVTMIKVNIDRESGRISVWNNGEGVPVVEHKKYKMMIPSMIFGELRTSSNYDDTAERETGGRNGYGAKLTNILSSEFKVETIDSSNNKKFVQIFKNNLSEKEEPIVTSASGKKSYTEISFIPDFERFKIKTLSSDMIALFKKRVYDMAMNVKAKVYYNDKLITSNSFAKYVDLYFPENSVTDKILDVVNEKWKVCVVYDATFKLDHQNISFVNGISTTRGGTHLDHVSNQIINSIKDKISKKNKDLVVKSPTIKENLIFFVDSVVINPNFDTQTKEYCKTPVSEFKYKYTAPQAFLNKILKSGVVESIMHNAQAKADMASMKNASRGKGPIRFEKLYDAHKAGSKDGHKCTLIITEGDSAKTFAMSGTNVIGRDLYGVFPIRGKFLNVREMTADKAMQNEEVKALIKIIGLVPGMEYTDLTSLRYGTIMILTDQDVDGYHIKGLLMNFIHRFWPSLAKIQGFIKSFATPLLKATRGKGKNAETIDFTNPQSYEEWRNKNNGGKGWNIKYFKGLGTSSPAQAQECFEDLDQKQIVYVWDDKSNTNEKKGSASKNKKTITSDYIDEESDVISDSYKPKSENPCEDAMTLVFDKKRADDRKIWVKGFNPKLYIDTMQKKVPYSEFFHKEFIFFSVDDCIRSIPNIMDGFKPVQRKIFYGSQKEGIQDKEIKVSELQGAVSKMTKYHHGDTSLTGAIIKMAQNFVGSNNINLLIPSGQFGSRMQGGSDAAAPRYLNTQLEALDEKIFRKEDYDVLTPQIEDSTIIEPEYYVPIIPMILVNGSEGIGTGYSTTVKQCNPRDIFNNIKRIMAGEKPRAMKPWYRHFTGSIDKVSTNKFVSRAKYEVINDDTIHITDLPIGVWTDDYKAFLDNLLFQANVLKTESKKESKKEANNSSKTKKSKTASKSKKTATPKTAASKTAKKTKFLKNKSKSSGTAKVAKTNKLASYIKSYVENCTEIRISFTITFHPGKLDSLIQNGELEKNLKLCTALNNTNMYLFNEHNKITKYESYGAILNNFAKIRLAIYQKRKDFLLGKWKNEMNILKWKLKFIEAVIADEIIVTKKSTSELAKILEELEYPKFATNIKDNPSHNYLTTITVGKLCTDEVKKLRQQVKNKKQEIQILENKSPSQLWEEELDELIEAYDEWEINCDEEYNHLMNKKKQKATTRKKNTKKKPIVEV